jgi:hypothetical protein
MMCEIFALPIAIIIHKKFLFTTPYISYGVYNIG